MKTIEERNKLYIAFGIENFEILLLTENDGLTIEIIRYTFQNGKVEYIGKVYKDTPFQWYEMIFYCVGLKVEKITDYIALFLSQ